MAHNTCKFHSTNVANTVSSEDSTNNVLEQVKAVLANEATDATVALGEGCQCLVSNDNGSVRILVTDVEGNYVFDKAYTRFHWAEKALKKFVKTVGMREGQKTEVAMDDANVQRRKIFIDTAPPLDAELGAVGGGLVTSWLQEEIHGAKWTENRASENTFGAVVDTQFVSATEIEALWAEETIVVAYTAKFSNGVKARIETTEGVVVELKFGSNAIQREAASVLEGKQFACSMASLLCAWNY